MTIVTPEQRKAWRHEADRNGDAPAVERILDHRIRALLDALAAAEAKVARAAAVLDCRLSNHHDYCDSWRRDCKCNCWRAELADAVGVADPLDD